VTDDPTTTTDEPTDDSGASPLNPEAPDTEPTSAANFTGDARDRLTEGESDQLQHLSEQEAADRAEPAADEDQADVPDDPMPDDEAAAGAGQ